MSERSANKPNASEWLSEAEVYVESLNREMQALSRELEHWKMVAEHLRETPEAEDDHVEHVETTTRFPPVRIRVRSVEASRRPADDSRAGAVDQVLSTADPGRWLGIGEILTGLAKIGHEIPGTPHLRDSAVRVTLRRKAKEYGWESIKKGKTRLFRKDVSAVVANMARGHKP